MAPMRSIIALTFGSSGALVIGCLVSASCSRGGMASRKSFGVGQVLRSAIMIKNVLRKRGASGA